MAACLATVCGLASAAVPPLSGRDVLLTPREQPVAAFLQELLGANGLSVVVSPAVKGTVNGRFQGKPDTILRDVVRAFSVTPYYDGAVVHVYGNNEITTRTLPISSAQADRVVNLVNELRISDGKNHLRRTQSGALVVVGTPRFLEQIDEVLRADLANAATRAAVTTSSPASPSNTAIGFRVFYLRYAWAQDTTMNFSGRQVVVPGVASILRNITSGLGQTIATTVPNGMPNMPGAAPQGPVYGDQLLRPSQPRLGGQGLAGIGRQNPQGNPADPAYQAQMRENDVLLSGVTPNNPYGPQRVVLNQVGGVSIVADPRSNAIIVRDIPERLSMYDKLIASLDIEPIMVEIEATIVDVNITRLEQLGINWRWVNGRNDVLFGNGTNSDLNLNANQTITAAGRGAFVSTVLGAGYNFISRINALTSNGGARITSRPQVMTLSNVEAIFDNSSTFYVRVAGSYQVDLFNVSSGTGLRVTPHVFRDRDVNRVKLLVNIEDGNISNTQAVDQIPVVERQTISTQAMVQEGESLLIGGLTRDSTTRNTDKVPLLGDVPVVGHLFRSNTDTTARIERLVMITPRVITLNRAAANAVPGVAPTGDAGTVQPMAPQGAMPAPMAMPSGPAVAVPMTSTAPVAMPLPAQGATAPLAPPRSLPSTPAPMIAPVTAYPQRPSAASTPIPAPASAPLAPAAPAATTIGSGFVPAASTTTQPAAQASGPALKPRIVWRSSYADSTNEGGAARD